MVTLLPSSTVYKTYKHYKTFKPKVIVKDTQGIHSTIIEEVVKSEEEARQRASELIANGDVCVLCGAMLPKNHPGRNNPEPLADGSLECCDDCNYEKVIPARLEQMGV